MPLAPRRAIAIALALASPACASPSIAGGESASRGREPPGEARASYESAACVDAAGGKFQHSTQIFWVVDAAQKDTLVISRQGADSIVLREPRVERGEQVFQVITDDANGTRVLFDYRIPRQGDGRMAATRRFVQAPGSATRVEAKPSGIDFVCKLARKPDEEGDAGS